MAYGFEAYEADRATIGFRSNELVTVKGLTLRRKRLLGEEGADQGVIDAAIERLKAWKESRTPEPTPPAEDNVIQEGAAPIDAGPAKAAQEATWAAMLTAQRARHARRRQHYPTVDPQAAGRT